MMVLLPCQVLWVGEELMLKHESSTLSVKLPMRLQTLGRRYWRARPRCGVGSRTDLSLLSWPFKLFHPYLERGMTRV